MQTTDSLLQISAIICYFVILICIAILSYRKNLTNVDFIMGNRSLNFFLTALAAHASDMSSWLFMAYPAAIFSKGLWQGWTGIGLLFFMFLNWKIVAPKIRVATEQYNSFTLSSFFESRFSDISGLIRLFTALMLFVFYTIYISSMLVGMGLVLHTLFGLDYSLGVIVGVLIVVPYVFIGGYRTLAWIDLFQGLFLLLVILLVPLYLLPSVGWFEGISRVMKMKELTTSLLPDHTLKTLLDCFFLMVGWGLGYFGQPHIVTKFMGIKNVSEIKNSMRVGMTWMTFALGGATLVGLVGVAFFRSLSVPENLFILMVKYSFPPFLVGLILCALFATTINAMSSMVLVLSSSIAEDVYKKVKRGASSKELLRVARLGVIIVSGIAFVIAVAKISTIYNLVFYAWSGLGASFGPLVLFCLYSKKVNKYGAWSGLLVGGAVAAIWPLFKGFFSIDVPALPPAFLLSCLSIWVVSRLTSHSAIVADYSST
jgi:sodium/proline symporter